MNDFELLLIQQEKLAQELFIENSDLPIDCHINCRLALEEAGVEFGEPIKSDFKPLFCPVKLPAGWKKVRRSELQIYLLDEKNRKRARIFYKPSIYDTRAIMSAVLCMDFSIDSIESCENPTIIETLLGRITNQNTPEKIIYEIKAYDIPFIDAYSYYSDMEKTLRAFLDKHFPNWECPWNYWDGIIHPLSVFKTKS